MLFPLVSPLRPQSKMPTLSSEIPNIMALAGPESPTGESRDFAFELMEILDEYNNNGCV